MKLLKYITLAFSLCLVIYSCKKDHSNVDMIHLPDFRVDTVGQQKVFETAQSVGEVVIDPKVVYTGDAANLTYLWRIYSASSSGDPNAAPTATVVDTISKVKIFKAQITRNPGNYWAEIQVTDKSTGVKALMRYTITVVASRPYGWLVAYETPEGGNTDVALIRPKEIVNSVTEDVVMKNIYSAVNGGPLTGLPVRIVGATMLVSEKGGARLNSPDYKKIADFPQMFVAGAPAPKPEGILERGIGGNHLVNNGDVYWEYSGAWVGKVTIDSKGYKAAPFGVRMYAKTIAFFDELNKRFLYVDQQVSQGGTFGGTVMQAGARFSLDNIQKTMVYANDGPDKTGNFTNQYAFFRDLDGSKTWFYGIDLSTPARPDLCMIDLTLTAPNINAAQFFEIGTLGSMAIYATATDIYNFAYDKTANTTNAVKLGFTAPAGEVITAMNLFKADGNGYSGATSKNNKILFVATWNAGTKNGKVYLLSVDQVSGNITSAPLKVFEGFGKIKDMTLKPS